MGCQLKATLTQSLFVFENLQMKQTHLCKLNMLEQPSKLLMLTTFPALFPCCFLHGTNRVLMGNFVYSLTDFSVV